MDTNSNIKNDDNLRSDDLLLYLDKYLTYLLPLKYLNHPFIITNTDGSITKLNCENNNFLEIEDTFIDEIDNKGNETLKSNCFLTIYPTLCDIKLDDEDSDSNSTNDSSSKNRNLSNSNSTIISDNSNNDSCNVNVYRNIRSNPIRNLNTEIEKKFNIKNLFGDPKEMIKESKRWIHQFINYYIFVLNWVKYEKLFKKHPSVNDRILARIMGFAYSILDNIANPDLNPAFQSFYLKDENTSQQEEEEEKETNAMSVDVHSTTLDNSMESSTSNSTSTSSSSSQYLHYKRKSYNNLSSSHSNNYANHIPVLPSNKTSLINYYSPKLRSKILLITKLIRILSRYETSSQLIGKNRGITILLQIMKLFGDSIEIQIECSASMANLASIGSNRVKMLEEGCINLILENMNKFITSSDVQAEICATLANLACHDANAKHIVDNGGCDYILRAMITHMDKTDLQIQAFHSLSSLCKYGKEIMEKETFLQVIKTSILKHQNSVDLMVSACNALGLMALSGIKMTSCKRTILIIILKAIKKFEDHQIFQITAFFSLSHLLCIHDAANSEIISKYKGVELILTAMKRFPYHISLQTTACFALESIIINHENHRKEFLELDGIDIILNVMRFDFSTLKKRRSNYENGQNDISDTIDENENIDVSITLDIDSSSESLFYSKYKDNSFHSFSKELLLQLFGSVALLNASDNKQCKEMIIKKGCLHYIYLASRKVASCNDLWLVLYYVFTRFSNSNENTETKSIYMKPHGVPTLLELCSKKIINKYTHNANKANLKNYDSQKTLIGTSSSSSLKQASGSISRLNSMININNNILPHIHTHTHNNNNNNNSNNNNSNSISHPINNNNNDGMVIENMNHEEEIREVEVDIALENNRNDEQGENINLVLVDEENHNITIIPSENNTINHNDNDSLSSSSSTITSISMNEEDIINNDLNIGEEEMIGNNDQNLNWLNNPLYTNNNYNSNSSINTPRNSNLTNNSIDTNNNMNIEENIENSIQNEMEDININDDAEVIIEENNENENNHENHNHNEEEDDDDDNDDNEEEDDDDENSDVEMEDVNNEEEEEEEEEVNNDENHDDINDNQSLDKLVKENPLLEQQKTEEWKQNEVKYLNSLPISGRVQDYLLSREYCCICGKACFESCLRLYSINRKKDCRLVYMCSVECAKKDSQFNKRAFYHVYPETAQIWWYEKQQEALKSKKNFKLKI